MTINDLALKLTYITVVHNITIATLSVIVAGMQVRIIM